MKSAQQGEMRKTGAFGENPLKKRKGPKVGNVLWEGIFQEAPDIQGDGDETNGFGLIDCGGEWGISNFFREGR